MGLAEDYELWCRISRHYPIANLSERVIRYRSHAGSMSQMRASQLAGCVREVHERQLRAMRLYPSWDELDTHYRIGIDETAMDYAEAERASDWLQRIRSANESSATYPRHRLEWRLGRLWFEVCCRSTSSLRAALAEYRRSPLHACYFPSWAALGRLSPKGVLRHYARTFWVGASTCSL
jgi:hypothetical protein